MAFNRAFTDNRSRWRCRTPRDPQVAFGQPSFTNYRSLRREAETVPGEWDTKDAEVFHQATIRHGGLLGHKMAPGSPPEMWYDLIAEHADSLISSARQHVPGLPHIHFDFVLNGAPNAVAFKIDSRYHIGMTTGILYLLNLVFCRMLSDSNLFPFIGSPSEEADHLPPLTGYRPEGQEMYEASIRPNRPKTDARGSYSSHLHYLAIQFLVGHEIAHITRGHVDYLKSNTGNGLIAELGTKNAEQNRLIESQTIDFDADRRAGRDNCRVA
jgi:hypothetical protein